MTAAILGVDLAASLAPRAAKRTPQLREEPSGTSLKSLRFGMGLALWMAVSWLLTERQASVRLGLSVRTLQKWRLLGQGPCYLKLGQAVRYDPDDLETFVQAARRSSTSERSSDEGGKASRA